MTDSTQIRDQLVRALRRDIIGPAPQDEDLAAELLAMAPSRWYLSGFLVPRRAAAEDLVVAEDFEGAEEDGKKPGGDDDSPPDSGAERRSFYPSSIGLSVLLPAAVKSLQATVRWGDYQPIYPEPAESAASGRPKWQRQSRVAECAVDITRDIKHGQAVPGSDGLKIFVTTRSVSPKLLPAGTRAVSVFLVNDRDPCPNPERDAAFAFQASLQLESPEAFVARPDLSGAQSRERDWDDKIADLQYRDLAEFAVGHNVAGRASLNEQGECRSVATEWMPSAQVERVEPAPIPSVTLEFEALAALPDQKAREAALRPMVEEYGAWIAGQRKIVQEDSRANLKIAEELFLRAERARQRISKGIDCLAEPDAARAFRIANRAVARAIRQRQVQGHGKSPESLPAPAWRPFQLAFLLMNLPGIVDPKAEDRDVVDLLFFPTGGGKTEAYLGLAAFTLILRRLRNKGAMACGVSVLMRYTLRLLTLDQLSRAATLICALEIERAADTETLGAWPFEIGLWVGQAATPNHMGKKGDKNPENARKKTLDYKSDPRNKAIPIPIETCPWCGEPFNRDSFELKPDADQPLNLEVRCADFKCTFSSQRALPIIAVDEPIYRRLPCFLIATVDKFANLPWVGQSGALFGKVRRHDKDGFYGDASSEGLNASRLPGPLPPPDLIIQDELHLISGPLGTMVGLYETCLNELATVNDIRPKIVASTATVRRAERQIRALFGRGEVEIFPAPGPDRRDSFFARTVPASQSPARLYVGLAAQGRSIKVLILQSILALLAAGQKLYDEYKGEGPNPVDPYMSLLSYFGSLRELGGCRRIIEDEVESRLQGYDRRRRENQSLGDFSRRRLRAPVELTSRESTARVANTRQRLALSFDHKDSIDVALATNMISVGLDISRLGLMVVQGQPKSSAEYIQATSRVGREKDKPGLVLTLLNVHRPRDRSHFERFESYHASFYRAVEATSVTPFSERALQRGLAGLVVALVRHSIPAMTAPARALEIGQNLAAAERLVEAIARRAEQHDLSLGSKDLEALREAVRGRANGLLEAWQKFASDQLKVDAGLQYQAHERGGAPALLSMPHDPELQNKPIEAQFFKAHRSMRDVEDSVHLRVIRDSEVRAE